MRKKSFLIIVMILITGMILLFIILPQAVLFFKHATPDPSKAADDAVARAQDLLNVINNFSALLGVMLAVFGIIIGVLAWLGASLYTDLNNLKDQLEGKKSELDEKIKALRVESENTRAALLYLNLGDRLLSQNETSEAIKYYEEARRSLPDDRNISYIAGRMYSTLGDADAAISAFKDTLLDEKDLKIEQRERQAEVLKELGLAYRRRGTMHGSDSDIEKAVGYLKQAIKLNPKDADAHSILGGLYRRQNEPERALLAYRASWEADKGSSYALGNLASLYWYLGKVSEARDYFSVVRVLAADRIKRGTREGYWDFYDLGLARLALGEADEAEKSYQQALKITPGPVQIEGVLDNLRLLRQAANPISGLDRIIRLIENAKSQIS